MPLLMRGLAEAQAPRVTQLATPLASLCTTKRVPDGSCLHAEEHAQPCSMCVEQSSFALSVRMQPMGCRREDGIGF